MNPRDSSRYRFTVEVKNHLDNVGKERNRKRELSRKANMLVLALFFLSFFLVMTLFGWSANFLALGTSLIVVALALFWFTRDKVYLVFGLGMILAAVLYFMNSLGYI